MIVTISGPTCSGKTTLENMLVKEHGFCRITSHTTRPMRPGEVNGKDYHFVTRLEMLDLIDQGQMVEHVEFSGAIYGASKSEFAKYLNRGKHIAVVVDPEGAKQIRAVAEKEHWALVQVFVDCPAHLIAERFIERVRTTIKAEAGLKALNQRLAEMLTIERHWVEESRTSSEYDVCIPLFDAKYTRTTLNQILSHVQLPEAA